MSDGFASKIGLIKAIIVCVVLLAIFVFFVRFVGLETFNVTVLLQITLLVCIGLVTFSVYQAGKVGATANDLAADMVKNMMLYSHELFTELYKGGPVPYMLIDMNGVIESTNKAAVRLFHITEGDLDGKNIFTYIETDNEVRQGLIPEYLKQGLAVTDEEVRIKRPDGTERWVMLSLFSFMDSKRIKKGLLTLVDITKQKQVDQAKTEFVSLASHQLRTPISAMKWNVELLESASPETRTELQNDYIKKIGTGLHRMDMLVDDFLNVSKFELGTLTTDPKDIELVSFVDELLDEHRKRASVHSITLEETWSEKPFQIHSDARLLTMIIGNLISNGIKYTKDGGKVSLRCHKEAGHVVIAVSDTGIGIPKDEHDQIFTKIFRASNAREQVAEGTGLGLHIVREAAKVLGGTIDFTSEEGVGTTFTVVLPE